ncbi:RHS repeat-associated core domain-containing protein [uncultured Pseudodesulfovibrio sp.]|uniref:RHS repeat domain-containing protein n=1 Tax=uncultured Pseudodesulfovibrio sp. TaxID=2035858 RepID=UPI0029C84A3B|nr:RHS repeat-associated core domain-containing protein [uncultured Pseudodesulfovibrio sp.]
MIRFLVPKIRGGEAQTKSSFFRSFFSALEKERTPPGGHGRSESDWISAFCLSCLSHPHVNPPSYAFFARFHLAPDYRLLGVTLPDGREIEYEHNKDGLPVAKKINGRVTARYAWKDFIRLASFHDGEYEFHFIYEKGERLPHAVCVNGRTLTLEYDQVGTLKAVVGETGNVIQAIQYDPFGRPLWTDNPALNIPLGFAGGLEDPDTGLVRFGWRDYDPDTGRWTALDPIGDAGGDDDWYGYCLDDPVNMIDPAGLMGSKPEEPDEGALYSANCVQWQASPGACEKCSELDGKYFDSESNAPDKPHPNCKCQLVECFYGSEYTEWKVSEKGKPVYDMPDVVVFPFALNAIKIWWTMTIIVKEKRERTLYKICGDRKDKIKTLTEYRSRKVIKSLQSQAICISSDNISSCSRFMSTNPWVWGDTRYGDIRSTH